MLNYARGRSPQTSVHAATEIQAADQTCYLTQPHYADTGPTSPSSGPITPDTWQGSHRSANFELTGMTGPRTIPAEAGIDSGYAALEEDALTTRPLWGLWQGRRLRASIQSTVCLGREAIPTLSRTPVGHRVILLEL